MEKEEFKIKSYTTKELAAFYGVTRMTFRNWLKRLQLDLGPRIGNYFSPTQVRMIVDKLGKPFVWIGLMMAKMFMGDGSQDEQLEDGKEEGQKLGREG